MGDGEAPIKEYIVYGMNNMQRSNSFVKDSKQESTSAGETLNISNANGEVQMKDDVNGGDNAGDNDVFAPAKIVVERRMSNHVKFSESTEHVIEDLAISKLTYDGGDYETGSMTSVERSEVVKRSAKRALERKNRRLTLTARSNLDDSALLKSMRKLPQNHSVRRSAVDIASKQKLWGTSKWLRYGIWTLLATVLMLVMGSAREVFFPDGNNPTCTDEDPWRNKSACGVMTTFAEGSQSLIFLSGFILGGFLLSTRSLWLARRSSYCALCGATRNLLINVTTLAPSEADRKLFARWALLGYELAVLKARSLLDSQEGKEYLEVSRLMRGNEWDSMVKGDRHTAVWYWIQSKGKQLKDAGRIDSFELQTICNAVTLSRDRANDLMSCIDRDQPLPYVFVCAIVVNVNLFFQSMANGFAWAEWMNDAGGFSVFTEPRLYSSMAVLYIFSTIYAMLFDVCALLYNPFGARDFDIKHFEVGQGIRFLAASLSSSKQGFSQPDTMEKLDNEGDYESEAFGSLFWEDEDTDASAADDNLRRRVVGGNQKNTLHFNLTRRTTFG